MKLTYWYIGMTVCFSIFNWEYSYAHAVCKTKPQHLPALQNAKPLDFIANLNQWEEPILYKVSLGKMNAVFLEKDKFKFSFIDPTDVAQLHDYNHFTEEEKNKKCLNAHAYQVRFLNAQKARVKGFDKHTQYHNYFIGNESNKWAAKVPLYQGVVYEQLYEGIDLKTYSQDGKFKYDFIVAPHIAPQQIQLQYEGYDRISIQDGHLLIVTSVGTIVEQAPFAYQMIDGKTMTIDCHYVLKDDILSFEFPKGYDASKILIIDPVLIASTQSGASDQNLGLCATYDLEGNIFTGGLILSQNYPVTLGAFQIDYNGSRDMVIGKLNPNGSNLLYATYLGGANEENVHSMITDEDGNLYIYGSTNSPNFPTSVNAFDTTHNGDFDISVSILSSDGSTLLGSTYIGGSDKDGINYIGSFDDSRKGEIYLDNEQNIYVASCTQSPDFPTSLNAIQTAKKDSQDGVLFKFNSDASQLLLSTYLGSNVESGNSGDDMCFSLRIDGAQNIYVCGVASGGDFPSIPGGLEPNYNGGEHDAFILKVSNDGSTVLNHTFYGSDLMSKAIFIDLDKDGDVVIFGNGEFPLGPTPPTSYYQSYIAAFTKDLSQLKYQTTVDGLSFFEIGFKATAFLVDDCNYIYFSGVFAPSGLGTTADALFSSSGYHQIYMGVLEPNATGLYYGSYYTGDHVDGGHSRFDENGVLYQAVCFCESNFNTTPDAWSSTQADNCDIGVFKFDFEVPKLKAVPNSLNGLVACAPFTIEFSNQGSEGDFFSWNFDDGNSIAIPNPIHTFQNPGTYNVSLIATGALDCNNDTAYLQIEVFDVGTNIENFNICENEELVLEVSFIDGAVYEWSDGSGDTTLNTQGIPDTYWVTTEITGCIKTDTFVVNTPGNVLDLGPDTGLCLGDFINFNLSNIGTNISWQDNSSNPNYTVFEGGLYWVELTVNGCTLRDSIEVTLVPNPTVDLGANLNLCLNDTLSLIAPTSTNPAIEYFYTWQDGSEEMTYEVSEGGTYWLSIETSLGSCINSDTIIVQQFGASVNLGADIIACSMDNVTLDVSSFNGEIMWQDNSSQSIYQVEQSGLYWVEINENGCVNRDSITIQIVESPNVNLGGDFNLCPNETLDILAPVSPNSAIEYFYTWQDGSEEMTYEVSDDGTYWVSIETSLGSCVNSDTIVVERIVNQPDLGIDVFICENEEEIFEVNLNDPDLAYQWQDGTDGSSFTTGESGLYWVEVSNLITGCKFRDSVRVESIDFPTLNDTTIIICDGESQLVDATTYSNYEVSYLWQDGRIEPDFLAEEIGIYEVEITLNGCVKFRRFSIENHPPLPEIDLGEDRELCAGEVVLLETLNDGNEYVWQDGSIGHSFLVDKTGEYAVKVSNSCVTVEDKIQIIINPFQDVDNPLLLPSAFSPNGDGINDLFNARIEGQVINYQLSVFNRWGETLYVSNSPEQAWDGSYQNIISEMGVYMWICQAQITNCKGNEENVFLQGNVTLIR